MVAANNRLHTNYSCIKRNAVTSTVFTCKTVTSRCVRRAPASLHETVNCRAQ